MKHMRELGIRALKQNASSVIAEVVAGDTLTITDRGRPVARIVPIDSAGSALDAMIAAGLVRIPKGSHGALGKPLRQPPGERSLGQVLREMREGERY
jgi:prevent-host-death family protein